MIKVKQSPLVKNRTAQFFTTGLSIAYSADLSDTKVAKREVMREKGLFRAYVLLEYDLGAAKRSVAR